MIGFMIKRRTLSTLTIFLFVFISVTFLIPSDLNAETQNFWVKDGHYEDQKVWVSEGHFKDTWVDTSHNVWVTSGYFKDTQEKRWVDTSHIVYQGYWKNVTKSFWIDTSHWVSSGYWKYVTERVWVKSGYTAYRDSKFWVDTSHWVKQAYEVWVKSGYTASRWVDTSHWETRYRTVSQAYSVWVSSGYWAGYWVNTSHWETRYRTVRQAYSVWVTSGYWKYYPKRTWVNTSHWETRYRNVSQAYSVWVSSGYWGSKWVNTSHWETRYRTVSQAYSVWVSSGYITYYWVDTSHYETRYRDVWVSSGYWQTYREAYWVDTSHWEDQKVGVPGHWETRYREVEDWQPCDVTFVDNLENAHPFFYCEEADENNPYKGTFSNGKTYKYKKFYLYTYFLGHMHGSPDEFFFAIRYKCYEVLNGYKKESYNVWVPPDYKKEWVDTSHWVKSGYSQSYNYKVWVDTSHMVESGYWENYTKRTWVDTSHNMWVSDGHTQRVWVDTSHNETKKVWVDTSHWVEADLDPEGKVLHTEKWNENRIKYNLSVSGDPEKPRGYEIFFNGEKFVLECHTPGDFQPESVHVEFLGTKFETDLTNTGDSKWEGYIWEESFIYFHDRDCVFKFTAAYDYNGDKFDIEDEVTVYIVRGYYWELHRKF